MELKYTDERDKCYGMTGMAISLIVWDADDLVATIDLDAPNDSSFEFVPTYYYSGNPRVSPKASWQHIAKHLQVSIGMVIGNVMCRSHLLHSQSPDDGLRGQLLDMARLEGEAACSLDTDEVETMFAKSYAYLDRIFAHRGVQQVAHRFADSLASQRTMTRAEIAEALAALSAL